MNIQFNNALNILADNPDLNWFKQLCFLRPTRSTHVSNGQQQYSFCTSSYLHCICHILSTHIQTLHTNLCVTELAHANQSGQHRGIGPEDAIDQLKSSIFAVLLLVTEGVK